MVHTVWTVNVVFSHDPLPQDCPFGDIVNRNSSHFLANTLGPTTEDLKMVRPLERLLLTANLKSSNQEKVAWDLAESIPKNSENSGTIYVIKTSK